MLKLESLQNGKGGIEPLVGRVGTAQSLGAWVLVLAADLELWSSTMSPQLCLPSVPGVHCTQLKISMGSRPDTQPKEPQFYPIEIKCKSQLEKVISEEMPQHVCPSYMRPAIPNSMRPAEHLPRGGFFQMPHGPHSRGLCTVKPASPLKPHGWEGAN